MPFHKLHPLPRRSLSMVLALRADALVNAPRVHRARASSVDVRCLDPTFRGVALGRRRQRVDIDAFRRVRHLRLASMPHVSRRRARMALAGARRREDVDAETRRQVAFARAMARRRSREIGEWCPRGDDARAATVRRRPTLGALCSCAESREKTADAADAADILVDVGEKRRKILVDRTSDRPRRAPRADPHPRAPRDESDSGSDATASTLAREVLDFQIRTPRSGTEHALEARVRVDGRRIPTKWVRTERLIVFGDVWVQHPPRTRVRALVEALRRARARARSIDTASSAADGPQRWLYEQPLAPKGTTAKSPWYEFLIVSFDVSTSRRPPICFKIARATAETSDYSHGDMAHMFEGARVEFKTSIPRSIRARLRVAVELCAGCCNVSDALTRVVDRVVAVDVVDARSERARMNTRIMFIQTDLLNSPESLGFDELLSKNLACDVVLVFVWASPTCRAYSRMRHAFYAKRDPAFKKTEQEFADILVSICLDYIKVSRVLYWVVENPEGELKNRDDVWKWIDDVEVRKISQCKFGRRWKKDTLLFMSAAFYAFADVTLPKQCSKRNGYCSYLTSNETTRHAMSSQDDQHSKGAELPPLLCEAVANTLRTLVDSRTM